MNPLLFSRGFAPYTAVVLYTLISWQGVAQQTADKPRPADQSVEIAGYLVQSDKELECNPEGARIWAKKALDTAASARETDPAMIDTLGDLKSQSNIKIAEATKRIEVLNDTAEQTRGLVKQARLETAFSRLQQIDPKSCFLGLKPVRSEIAARKSKADVLVKQGDANVRRDPRGAIKLYAAARQIDEEFPGLDEKANLAKNPAPRAATRPSATSGATAVGASFATLYIIRPKSESGGGSPTLFVDRSPIARVGAGRFLKIRIAAGLRLLGTDFLSKQPLSLNVVAGQTYYFRSKITWRSGNILEPMNAQDGSMILDGLRPVEAKMIKNASVVLVEE